MGVLSLAGGTYPSLGVPNLAREVPYLAGGTYLCLEYLPLQGVPTLTGEVPTLTRRYLLWLGEVPTFFGMVSTLAMGIPFLVGEVLTLTWGTYLSWGYLPLLGQGIYPGQGDVPSLVI